MPNVSHVAGRRRRVRAPIENPHRWSSARAFCVLAAGARYALERAFVAGRLVRGERQEQLLQVAAGLEPSGVDAALGQGPVHLRRSGGGNADRDPAGRRVGNLYLLLTGKPAEAADRLGHLAGRDADPHQVRPVEEVGHRPFAHQATGRDDPDHVRHLLHLGQEMAGHEHRLSFGGEVTEGLAHGHDPRRVEPVGRLVEQEEPGVAEQRRGDAQSLLHAERVAGDLVGRPLAEAHQLEELLDSARPTSLRRWSRWPAGSRGPTGKGRTTGTR